jgi:hypothetical protein
MPIGQTYLLLLYKGQNYILTKLSLTLIVFTVYKKPNSINYLNNNIKPTFL